MRASLKFNADQAGIASAVLCTVHCLVIPILFLLKFSWTDSNAGYYLPPWWEKPDYVFLAISFLAVYHAAGHTKAIELKTSLWISWSILAIAIIFEAHLHWMAYIASAGLVTTHSVNIYRMRGNIKMAKTVCEEDGSV